MASGADSRYDCRMSRSTSLFSPRLRRHTATTVLGPLLVIVVAAATSRVGEPMAVIDIWLILALITVAIALLSATGGIATSMTGALALNYFHTQPLHSLRMTDVSELIAVLLLTVLGLAVSGVTARRVRAATIAERDRRTRAARARALGGVRGRPVADAWIDAVASFESVLADVTCRLADESADDGLPRLALRDWRGADEDPLVLPACGAIVEFPDPRLRVRLVIAPLPGSGSLAMDRRAISAFVDQFALALSLAGTG